MCDEDRVNRYARDLAFIVEEIDAPHQMRRVCFRLKQAFAGEAVGCEPLVAGAVDFAIEEAGHVNIWKNRLQERGLPVGPWLRELKRVVMENRPDDTAIRIDEGRGCPQ